MDSIMNFIINNIYWFLALEAILKIIFWGATFFYGCRFIYELWPEQCEKIGRALEATFAEPEIKTETETTK
jgi:hypothetical protein